MSTVRTTVEAGQSAFVVFSNTLNYNRTKLLQHKTVQAPRTSHQSHAGAPARHANGRKPPWAPQETSHRRERRRDEKDDDATAKKRSCATDTTVKFSEKAAWI